MWVQQLAIKKCWFTCPTHHLHERKRHDFVPAPICWVTSAPSPWRIKALFFAQNSPFAWLDEILWSPTSRQRQTTCWKSRSRRMCLENDDEFQIAIHKSCGNKRGNLMVAVCPTHPFTEAVLRGTLRETTWVEQPVCSRTHTHIYIYTWCISIYIKQCSDTWVKAPKKHFVIYQTAETDTASGGNFDKLPMHVVWVSPTGP